MGTHFVYSKLHLQYPTEMLYLNAIHKLAIKCALSTVRNGAANMKGLNVELFKTVDISMLLQE